MITQAFVDNFVTQTYGNLHLILIDDGSTDGTEEMVRSKVSVDKLTVIKGDGDLWWAGSLQKGIDWLKRHDVSDDEVVVFMNDDVIFDADFFRTALEILGKRSSGMLLPQVLNEASGIIEESGIHADLKKLVFEPAASPAQINCMPTRGLFMRMSDLRSVGDFFPRLLPHYLSDYEFTIRAKRKGTHLWTSPKLLIRFNETPITAETVRGSSIVPFLPRYFSKKNTMNPIYWTTFILLTSPIMFVPWNIARIWLSAGKATLDHLVRSFSGRGGGLPPST